MRRSNWTPSIVQVGAAKSVFLSRGLGTVWREADVERDLEARGSMSAARVSAGLGPTAVLQRKSPVSGLIEPDLTPSDLVRRAQIAAKQMRYFWLAAQKSSFSELLPSANRAGFTWLYKDSERREAGFRWAAGEPDIMFSVSFEHTDRVSVVGESCGDIFGLVLVGHSHVPNISVETKPSLGNDELGRNALSFRDVLLTFPEFDGVPAWTKY